MSFRPILALGCASMWLVAAANGVVGQTTSSGTAFENQFPDPLQYQLPFPEPPELRFATVAEIDLSGPLVSGPRLIGDQIEIRTAAGARHRRWLCGGRSAGRRLGLDRQPRWEVPCQTGQ
jgi:hypothetical protein